jgi:hypothetical protein
MSRAIAFTLVAAWMAAVTISAGGPVVQLSIRDGRVWLNATNATPREILAEWTRVGGTRIVNAERLPGGPLTLQLDGVPELQALDALLRSAGGFIASSRADATAGQSRVDRIVIVPAKSVALPSPPPPVATATVVTTTGGVQRLIGANGMPIPDDQEDTPGAPPARPAFSSIPPGFSAPPDDSPQSMAPNATPTSRPTAPVGVLVPGTIVPPPAPSGQPRPRS